MTIDYNSITEVLDVNVGLLSSNVNPLILFRVKYKTPLKVQQEYYFPTDAENARILLNGLLERKLITEIEFKKLKDEIGLLEQQIILNPSYRFQHPR